MHRANCIVLSHTNIRGSVNQTTHTATPPQASAGPFPALMVVTRLNHLHEGMEWQWDGLTSGPYGAMGSACD